MPRLHYIRTGAELDEPSHDNSVFEGRGIGSSHLLTFLLNLTSGAFLSTTLPGIIPFVGALGTIAITLIRGFIISVTYPEILASSAAVYG